MDNVWLATALWIGLALISALISIRLALSVALIEIMVGAIAGNVRRVNTMNGTAAIFFFKLVKRITPPL